MISQQQIDDFLAQKRFAFVGVSRKADDFSRALFREFRAQGYEPVPVHPEASEIEGEHCYRSLADIRPPVDSALLMTSPAGTGVVADDCVAAGIKRVWMYRGGGNGALNGRAIDMLVSMGVDVIPGECPMMFLPNATWIHRFHGFVKKITGSYPRPAL